MEASLIRRITVICSALVALVVSSLIGCAQTGVVGELGDAGSTNSDATESSEALIQRCRDLAFGLGGVCIDYAEYPVFAMRCSAVNTMVLREFNACASAGGCPDDTCLSLLVPRPDPPEPEHIADCKLGCDMLHSFECITAADHSECFSLCETVSSSTASAFTECASFLCNRPGCFEALSGS